MSEDLHSLSGAYVLDALTEQERADFEMHLRRCPTCRDEVDSLREVVPLLAETVASEPPPSLRESILDQAARTRQDPPVAVQQAEVTPAVPDRQQPAHARVVPLRGSSVAPQDGALRRRRWAVGLAAAAALVVGGGVTWQVVEQTTTSVTEQIASAPDARTWQAETTGGATIAVTRSENMGEAVLQVEGLADPGEGHAYQAWLQNEEGNMVPAGVMTGTDGEMVLDGDVSQAKGVGVTVEPAGGSEQPTTDPIALIVLS
ncbi:anti-sigma factor [Janibacter cremeus]|uniref:Regulator of SigK n=1 Tax=Janibacter cremeus TaxID=1285192 RepID=A0A852VSX1_9MICO|nr:anti-sigma factor [Janibacter cremeus]NYF99008.1 anti-sigma factor RsiW [Janibacter cremeus]